jgi:HEPN domain-containing protein
MNRTDFQNLAELRLEESKALLAAGFPDGAYYLAGYAVECALKACIAKRTREHDFPDKALVLESHTHSLKELLRLAVGKTAWETEISANPALDRNWTILLTWSETGRYEKGRTAQQAADLIDAIENAKGGMLPWVRQRW